MTNPDEVTDRDGLIRILLLAMPRSLRRIILEIVAAAPDMEIVDVLEEMGRPLRREALFEFVAAGQPHVVIVGLDAAAPGPHPQLPELARAVLDNLPGTAVLALSADGRSGGLYELRPQRTPLGELAPEVLVTTIRETGRPR